MTMPSDQPGPWGAVRPEAPPEAPPVDNRSISPIALALVAVWLGSGSALGVAVHVGYLALWAGVGLWLALRGLRRRMVV